MSPAPAPAPAGGAAAAGSEWGIESFSASRVMVVDDEGGNLLLLKEVLKRAEIPLVSGFDDPEAALDAATRRTPDLILLDIMMPRLDGYGFLGALRQRLPDAELPPVLMMTGMASDGAKLRALELGATDFVTKPFEISELLLRIRNALRTRSLQTRINRQNQALEAAVRERTWQLEEALQRAESAARAKAHFLAKVSHELRTPLNPLIGALEMLTETESTPQQRKLVDMASRSAKQMNSLVGDILLLQRLDQGTVVPDPMPTRLGVLLERVIAPLAASTKSEIRLVVSESIGKSTLLTDETHLADVVRRIVENAIRFSPPGSTITVGVETDADDEPVAIEVADEGPGIPVDRREAMFAAFEQLDNSSVRAHNGAGLGLAICMRLCELLGATLNAADRPGGGTVFRVGLGSMSVKRAG